MSPTTSKHPIFSLGGISGNDQQGTEGILLFVCVCVCNYILFTELTLNICLVQLFRICRNFEENRKQPRSPVIEAGQCIEYAAYLGSS